MSFFRIRLPGEGFKIALIDIVLKTWIIEHCKLKIINMTLDRSENVDVPDAFPYGFCLTEGDVAESGVEIVLKDDVPELNEAGFPNSRVVYIEDPVDEGRVLSLLADFEDDVDAVEALEEEDDDGDDDESDVENLVDLFNSDENEVYGIRDSDDEMVDDNVPGFDLADVHGVGNEELDDEEESFEGWGFQDIVIERVEEALKDRDENMVEDFLFMDPAVLSMARKVNRRVARGSQIRDGVDDDAVVGGLTQGQLNRLGDRTERLAAEKNRNQLLDSPSDADDLFEEEEGFEGWMSEAL